MARNSFLDGIKLLRIHQWVKNLLLFIPLLMSVSCIHGSMVTSSVLAFFSFSLGASACYVFNDLIDLPFDRLHIDKRRRPLANGTVSATSGLVTSLILSSLSIAIGFFLSQLFMLCLITYFAMTIIYTLDLKRRYLVDVFCLSAFFALRLFAGSAATGISGSNWLLGFSLLFFLSLALLKRYTELLGSSSDPSCPIPGRAYKRRDIPMIGVVGPLSGYLAVVMIIGYLNDPGQTQLFRHPQWIWVLCPMTLFWITRVWHKAAQGRMHHDPLVFLLRDPVSSGMAVLALLTITAAQF